MDSTFYTQISTNSLSGSKQTQLLTLPNGNYQGTQYFNIQPFTGLVIPIVAGNGIKIDASQNVLRFFSNSGSSSRPSFWDPVANVF